MDDRAYPLAWPAGRPRTSNPQRSKFWTSMVEARDGIIKELERLGASYPVISSNLALRNDGLPRASQAEPRDSGVAVYFLLDGEQMCFACDRWDRVQDNLRAIQKTIEALRGISRWGSGDMVGQAFSGFAALPAPANDNWREVLGLAGDITAKDVQEQYRVRAKYCHPDHPEGSHEKMQELNEARDAALREVG